MEKNQPVTRLFLLGDGYAEEVVADEFVAAAGGRSACMVALTQSLSGWEKYRQVIAQPWLDRGVTRIQHITPDASDHLDISAAQQILRQATGIFIGGGNTAVYHRLFVDSPLAEVIRERFSRGIPVAGVSAGALVCVEFCQLEPEETGQPTLQVVPGLGLVKGFALGVHYTESNALPQVLEVLRHTGLKTAFGVDEHASAVFINGRFSHILGQSVYLIKIIGPQAQEYSIARLGE